MLMKTRLEDDSIADKKLMTPHQNSTNNNSTNNNNNNKNNKNNNR